MNHNQITLFEEKNIRHTELEGETWFSVIDIIEALTNSENPRRYWTDLKRKLEKEGSQLYEKIVQLKLTALDGRNRLTDCSNTEGVLRIIQSVPSPKAKPFKMWLANVVKQAIEGMNDPELGFTNLKEIYKAKGYTDEWIEAWMKGIDIRKQLTDEWQKRGVKEGQEYALLTAEIAQQTFGLTPSEHSKLKNLQKENLRDHMTNLELIFTMLGEEVTRSFAVEDDAQGFNDNHDAARKGGKSAGEARKRLEKVSGRKVVSNQNFLKQLDKGDEKD